MGQGQRSPIYPGEELDLRLIRTKGGVDAALEYAKMWSRYAKELLAWTEKRANYGEAPSAHQAPVGSEPPRADVHCASLSRAGVHQEHHEDG